MIRKTILLTIVLVLITIISCRLKELKFKDHQYEEFVKDKIMIQKEDSLNVIVNDEYYNKGFYTINNKYIIDLAGLYNVKVGQQERTREYMDKFNLEGDLLIKDIGIDTFLVYRNGEVARFYYDFDDVFKEMIHQ